MNNKNKAIFKIKFSLTILLLSIAVYILCGLGIIVSVWRMVKFGVHGFSDVIKYPFLVAVCLFCIVIVTAIFIKAQYVVDDKNLITQYGFIKSKFPVKTITSLLLDIDTKKLTVHFGEEYILLTVAPEWNEKFVRALLAVNPDIDYSFTLTSAPEQDNKSE
jgi:hypothetical protein